MSGFYYFLPHLTRAELLRGSRVDHATLAQRQLDAVLWDAQEVPRDLTVTEVLSGPGGLQGLLLYPMPPSGEQPERVGYDPELQEFVELSLGSPISSPAAGGDASSRGAGAAAWIGWLKSAPPKPEDLQRRENVGGRMVSDALGDPWVIPVARAHDNPRGVLPFSVKWDAAGQRSVTVAARYRQLWDASARLWDLMAAAAVDSGGLPMIGESFSADVDAFAIGLVTAAIEANYRLAGPVWHWLDHLRPDWCSQLFLSLAANALVDFHARREWELAQKKTDTPSEPAGVSSTPGEPAASPDSAPPAANSG